MHPLRFPNNGIRAKPRGHERLRLGRKGLLPTARPQGAAACGQTQVATAHCKAARGSPATRAVACKCGRWQERPPAREVPPEGSSACRKGGCPHRRHAASLLAQGNSDNDSADRGKAWAAALAAGQRRWRQRRWGQGEG
ncbi:hypothetical protein BHM03_00054930 [Ensete ventricosum]|nr:hypothetical protein BHM03_00054930 [Ensete ventricosum]